MMEATDASCRFDNFAIVGLGMIGGSIAKDIRSRFPDSIISAIDPSEATIARALEDNIIDEAINFEDIGRAACFVVIASPINTVIPVTERISESVGNESRPILAIDVASVKTNIVEAFNVLSNSSVEFIGTHPMAGTEFAGLEHARKNLFQGKPWMICGHGNNTDTGMDVVKKFIRIMGGRIREMDAVAHDKHVAVISHSVIMLSNYIFDYVASQHPDSLELAGDGFTSTTRLASGNPELHRQIIESNEAQTLDQLKSFRDYLSKMLDDGLIPSDDFFPRNVYRRNSWLHKKK